MRKVFWCCLAASAVLGCAFGVVAYVSQNPDSAVGRVAVAAAAKVGVPAPVRPSQVAVVEADDLIPDDPVPVGELPLLPVPGSHVPPAVAALMAPPPIVIHDEEDLNTSLGPIAKAQPSTSAHVDVEALPPATYDIHAIGRLLDGDHEAAKPTSPLLMPYCSDDASTAPTMPYCTDDEPAATQPPGDKDMSKAGRTTRQFDTYAFWMGFFSGPAHVLSDPSGARWQEDAHSTQQYSGAPYTSRPTPTEQPTKVDAKVQPVSGVEEPTETPAPLPEKQGDSHNQTSRTPHQQMKRMVEPASDTMEVRPGDSKPYSLQPGPY